MGRERRAKKILKVVVSNFNVSFDVTLGFAYLILRSGSQTFVGTKQNSSSSVQQIPTVPISIAQIIIKQTHNRTKFPHPEEKITSIKCNSIFSSLCSTASGCF